MKAKFNGTVYNVDLEPIDGICTAPDGKCPPTIMITGGLRETQRGLETCLHEALHASKWNADEKQVHRAAKDIARFLWRLGWRLP